MSAAALSPPADTLALCARAIVCAPSPQTKIDMAHATAQAWFEGRLSRGMRTQSTIMPDRPGRPERPQLLMPRDMPRRAMGGTSGKVAHVHALAHIELNAIDLTWDLVGRFFDAPAPRSFLDDFVQVGLEEAKHTQMLMGRLADLDSYYGALPAHDGLWQSAQITGHSVLARTAIIPLVLEARGLDVTPSIIEKARSAGDHETAAMLEVIYNDEKTHVAKGLRWFRHFCALEGREPMATFQMLVRLHFRGGIKPPFNEAARAEAGLVPCYYKPLLPLGGA